MKRLRFFYLIALISTLFFAFLQIIDIQLIREHIESKTYDFRLRIRNLLKLQEVSSDIVIVTVDEKSLQQVGRWPWGRDVQADLISAISSGRPKAIGIDIMYSEPEDQEKDAKLARALSKAGNVVLATAFFVPKGFSKAKSVPEAPGVLWDSAFMEVKAVKGIKWKDYAAKPDKVSPPIEVLAKNALLGHVYTHSDMDGVTRWEVLALNYGNDCYPHLSLQVARIGLGIAAKDMILYGGSGIQLGERFIHTDLSGKVLINYIGEEHSFPYLSASDVLSGKVRPEAFRDKIILVGTSALATHDQKITPFSGNMPGVEKNATVIQNIIQNNFLVTSPGTIEVVCIVLAGIFMGFVLPRLKAVPSAAIAVGFMLFYLLLSIYLITYHNLWITLVYPGLNMAAIFSVQTVVRFFFEEKKAREIRQMFSSYVSPKIVQELMENPDKAKLGGERRTVTVFFSDVIGFTTLSEKRQPEEVVALLNEYFTLMTEIIFKWDGTLDKFVGDEIMVFWGAPVSQPDHADRAVRCAMEMSDRLDELRDDWKKRGIEGLNCGMGINTGEAIIGNIGAQGKKMDYTAIGDTINLGARVEKLTRQYNTRILITDNTYNEIKPLIQSGRFEHYSVEEQATVKVKGKEQDVKVYALRRETEPENTHQESQ